MKILSIAWFAQQRRGETLARRLDAEFIKLPCPYRRSPFARLLQYRRLSRQTNEILHQRKPNLVVVQNPPIHAVAAVARYSRQTRGGFIIDSHSGPFLDRGVRAKRHRRRFARLGRQALVTLLHNEDLVPYAEELGLAYLVLEAPVPQRNDQVPMTNDQSGQGRGAWDEGRDLTPHPLPLAPSPVVVVVCGYGRDEPLGAALKAAALMPDVHFCFTGLSPVRLQLPANAIATGFLAEDDYWRLLKDSDLIVALTTREATILGGGYDALAAAKPLVLSRTHTLECLFPKGAVLVENQPEVLAEGIRQGLDRADDLIRKGQQLREEKARTWERQFKALQRIISERNHVRTC